MLGDVIANLDRPNIAAAVLTTLTQSLLPGSSDAPLRRRCPWPILPPALFATSWSGRMTNTGSNCSP